MASLSSSSSSSPSPLPLLALLLLLLASPSMPQAMAQADASQSSPATVANQAQQQQPIAGGGSTTAPSDATAAANTAILLPWRTVARAWSRRRDCDETFVAELLPDNVVVSNTSAPTNSTGSGLKFACLRDVKTQGDGNDSDNDNDQDDNNVGGGGGGGKSDNDQDDNNNKELVWRVGVCALQNYTGAAMFDAPKGQDAQQPALSVEPFGPGTPATRTEPLTIAEDECRIIDGRADEQSVGTAQWSALLKDLRAGRVYVAAKTVENPSGEIRGQLERLGGGGDGGGDGDGGKDQD